jgi:hypothetical protein
VWTDLDGMIADAAESRLFDQLLGGRFQVVERAWGRRPSWATWTVLAPRGRARGRRGTEGRPPRHHPHEPDVVISATPPDAIASCRRSAATARCVSTTTSPSTCPKHARLGCVVVAPLRPVTPRSDVRFYRGGASYTPSREACADAITEQAMGTYDFRAVVERAYADGARVFVEHGPRDACARWIDRSSASAIASS